MDILSISELAVPATIGVYDWEKKIQQTLLFSLEIAIDTYSISDRIEDTINYDQIVQNIKELCQNNSYALIETVANTVAREIKANFNIDHIKVTVCKPKAIPQSKGVSISVER